ncbi:winged helix-turn-helix transcriptional regulator [Kitasatospora sp. NRRL B-11411]|uniref:winged helix-turn-helix transcriptional regulator n=1 Tax=Kitasatospora sp. NRRL B-11411 TaxID=1463822 RepID=UPI0004C34E6A|nr:winged helix-turn-helix transcriptional regulator [Kitasatospora sp. NRRL B-11411]
MPATANVTVLDRAQLAAEGISTRWSTRLLRTLGSSGPLRKAEIASSSPIPAGSLYKVTGLLERAGAITRLPIPGSRRYELALTDAGRALDPVHAAAKSWADRHLVGRAALEAPEAIDDALGLFAIPHTGAVLVELVAGESLTVPQLAQRLPVPNNGILHHRLSVLAEQGLISRSGSPRAYRWAISEAGMHTGAMVRELSGWAERYLPSIAHPDPAARASSAALTSGTGAVVIAAPRPAAARTDAARLRRDTLRIHFSHAPGPQPPALLQSAAGPRR